MKPSSPILFFWLLLDTTGSAYAGTGSENAIAAVRQQFGPGVTILSTHTRQLDWVGDALTTVKFIDPATGLPTGLTFDSQSSVAVDNGSSRIRANLERRFAEAGAISDRLWDAIGVVGAGKSLPVAIWLRTYEPDEGDGILAAVEAGAVAKTSRQRAQSCLAAELMSLGSGLQPSVHFVSDAPVVYADLTAPQIMEIGSSPCVAAVYLVQEAAEEFTGGCDFYSWGSPYVGSTRAELAGLDGAGQTVCMNELLRASSPNNLVVSADFCPSDPAAFHARMTTGIVRSNVQGAPGDVAPYGIAPAATTIIASHNATACGGAPPAMAFCANQGARSWSITYGLDEVATRLVDYRARRWPYPLVAIAAGQYNTTQYNPSARTAGRNVLP